MNSRNVMPFLPSPGTRRRHGMSGRPRSSKSSASSRQRRSGARGFRVRRLLFASRSSRARMTKSLNCTSVSTQCSFNTRCRDFGMRVASWTNGSSRAAAHRSVTRPEVGPFYAHASRAREPHAKRRRLLGRHCAPLPWPGRANSRRPVQDVAARGTVGRPLSDPRIEGEETRSRALVLVPAEPRVRRLSWTRAQSRNATRGEDRQRTPRHPPSHRRSERRSFVSVRVPSGTRGRAALLPAWSCRAVGLERARVHHPALHASTKLETRGRGRARRSARASRVTSTAARRSSAPPPAALGTSFAVFPYRGN